MDYAPPYRHVAPIYDLLATSYSLGAIDRAKADHHRLIKQGDRVLYSGAGCGKEIVSACKRGANATCVEPCPAMAERLHQRLAVGCENFMIVPRPIQELAAQPDYDIVVAHFFLNLFDAQSMPDVLKHLSMFVKPGGRLVIADFKPPAGNAGRFNRIWRWLYYRPLNVAGWMLRICALHPIYDYTPLALDNGFTLESRIAFPTTRGLAMYEVLTLTRNP